MTRKRTLGSVGEPPVNSSALSDASSAGKLLLTVEEAAGLLSIGRTRVFALLRTGELASVLVGSSRRITPEALERYVAALHGARDVDMARRGIRPKRQRPAAHGLESEVLPLPFDDLGGGAVVGA